MSRKKFHRLPGHIKPKRYELMIKPNLESFTYDGRETIFLELGKASREITLHCKEIVIESAGIGSRGYELGSRSIVYNKKAETSTIRFGKRVPKGKAELKLSFKGILNDQMRGFYRSRYTHQGKDKYMATTQFEATDARRAFPCFDEPAQKAIFDVTLMVPKELAVISNTIETSVTEHESGYKIVKFQPTPKMSTYLLAMIVGDFEFVEGKTKKGIVVRVFTTPGKTHQAKFALETAIRVLEFYNEYFGIRYPLPVLDLIAIPDFTAAAMENWGAITYRETAVLVDPENTSASNKQWVAIVIAHEIAHQWFGNLVTMHWWTDLWLNEGFAAYMENLVTDKLFPEYDIMGQFVASRFESALKLDGLNSTHPIEVEVHHPDEINEIFDSISYAKGSAVIRMLAEYLGEKHFRDGLRHYLKKHAYKNTKTDDLWAAFEKISKKPVRKMMQNWTKKPGYPMVRLIEEKGKLKIIQSRYFSSPISKQRSKDATIWQTPISFLTDKRRLPEKSFLEAKSKTLITPSAKWLKFNAGEVGFFRTDYPSQMLAALHQPIKRKQLPATDRLGIIRDSFALAESGDLPTTQALELLKAYENETDYTVWTEIAGGLANLNQLIFDQPYYPEFKKFAQSIYDKIVKRVGFTKSKNEPHTFGLLRSLALLQHGIFGGRATLTHFQTQFQNYRVSGKKPQADLRGVCYQLALSAGGKKDFDFLIGEHNKESFHEEQDRIARALGAAQDKALLVRALNFSISRHVRPQDSPFLAVAVGRNPLGRELEWKFVQKNWPYLSKHYGRGGHLLEWFVVPAGKFHDAEKAKEFEKFFKKHPTQSLTRTIQQIIESIYANAAWLERDGKHIEKWLRENI